MTVTATGVGWSNPVDDQTAAEVPFTPYSTIAAANVQAAIQEIVDECCNEQDATEITYVSPVAPLTATTVEAALDQIAPCLVCNVAGTNTCVAGGLGNGFMVRSASVAAGTLTLNSAPEHTSLVTNGSTTDATQITIAAGNTHIGAVSPVVTLNNPSTCRTMNVQTLLTSIFAYVLNDGSVVDSLTYFSLNGAPFVLSAVENRSIAGATLRFDHRIIEDSLNNVAASGSISWQLRCDIAVYAGSVDIKSALANVGMFGVTA